MERKNSDPVSSDGVTEGSVDMQEQIATKLSSVASLSRASSLSSLSSPVGQPSASHISENSMEQLVAQHACPTTGLLLGDSDVVPFQAADTVSGLPEEEISRASLVAEAMSSELPQQTAEITCMQTDASTALAPELPVQSNPAQESLHDRHLVDTTEVAASELHAVTSKEGNAGPLPTTEGAAALMLYLSNFQKLLRQYQLMLWSMQWQPWREITVMQCLVTLSQKALYIHKSR
jgi:hypothetical protein